MKDQQLAAKIHPVERLMPRHAEDSLMKDQQLAAKIHPAEKLMPRHALKHSLKLTHAVPRTWGLALKVLNAEDSHLNQLHAAKIIHAEKLMPRHAQKHSHLNQLHAAKIIHAEKLMPRLAQKHSHLNQLHAAKIHPAERLMPRHAQKHSLKLIHAALKTQKLALKVLNAEDSLMPHQNAAKITPAMTLSKLPALKHSPLKTQNAALKIPAPREPSAPLNEHEACANL